MITVPLFLSDTGSSFRLRDMGVAVPAREACAGGISVSVVPRPVPFGSLAAYETHEIGVLMVMVDWKERTSHRGVWGGCHRDRSYRGFQGLQPVLEITLKTHEATYWYILQQADLRMIFVDLVAERRPGR